MFKKNRSSLLLLVLSILGVVHTILPLVKIKTTPPDQHSNLIFISFQVALGVLLLYLPILIEKFMKIRLPQQLIVLYWLFIYFSVFLGTGLAFYSKIAFWDKFLHTYSAMISAAVGFSLALTLFPPIKNNQQQLIGYVLFSFAFSMTIGVIWEFYEHSFDGLLSLNMQRHTIKNIPLTGRDALKDTMGDLYANAFGAFVYSIVTYFQLKHNHQKDHRLLSRQIKRN